MCIACMSWLSQTSTDMVTLYKRCLLIFLPSRNRLHSFSHASRTQGGCVTHSYASPVDDHLLSSHTHTDTTHSSYSHALGCFDQGNNLRLVGHCAPFVDSDDLFAGHAACTGLEDGSTRGCHTHCLGARGWHCH